MCAVDVKSKTLMGWLYLRNHARFCDEALNIVADAPPT